MNHPTIHNILAEINENNSSNHKLAVLKKYSGNEFLQQVLQMTHDTVRFTYGITNTQIEKFEPIKLEIPINLEFALASLVQNFSTRNVTGHAALQLASNLIGNLDDQDADLLKKIINRDLRTNLGKTQINKVWKGLITKPVYMRCDLYSKKNAKHINLPAIVQLKADGTYREFKVHNVTVESRSRSGESYDYPLISNQIEGWNDGVYVGELTIKINSDNIDRLGEMYPEHYEEFHELLDEEHTVLPRSLGNGIINSDNPPHEDIVLDLWDYITLDEYEKASLKNKKDPCIIPYQERFNTLQEIVNSGDESIRVIDHLYVDTIQEALEYCSGWMNKGFEGAILKDLGGVFKDGTPKYQQKLKISIDCEVRITGFHDGKKSTNREGKVGSIIFENDEGTIKGKASGFTDKQMDEFTANKEYMLGKVMTVQFNDLSKSKKNDFYALSHPRFIELREDKDETDTLEKVFELRQMAIDLS